MQLSDLKWHEIQSALYKAAYVYHPPSGDMWCFTLDNAERETFARYFWHYDGGRNDNGKVGWDFENVVLDLGLVEITCLLHECVPLTPEQFPKGPGWDDVREEYFGKDTTTDDEQSPLPEECAAR